MYPPGRTSSCHSETKRDLAGRDTLEISVESVLQAKNKSTIWPDCAGPWCMPEDSAEIRSAAFILALFSNRGWSLMSSADG